MAVHPIAMECRAERSALADWIAPARTAVLIIDMQVDFVSPEGLLAGSGADMSRVGPALGAAMRLADGARAAGAVVIFIALETSEDGDSKVWRERIRRRGGAPQAQLAVCRAGEPGAAFHGPLPAPGDAVVSKSRYSSFHGTVLGALLEARRIDTLLVCGVTTECCVDSTIRDAHHRDYHVFAVTDACAGYDAALHAAALRSLEASCALLTDTDQVLAAWGVPADEL